MYRKIILFSFAIALFYTAAAFETSTTGVNADGVADNSPDVNEDGRVDIFDLALVGRHFGEIIVEPIQYNPDVNSDSAVDISDLVLMEREFGGVSYDDDDSLDFIWTAASGEPHHYNVYVLKDEGRYALNNERGYELVGITETNSYTIIGESGHTYRMKVEAVDAAGNIGPMSKESDLVICR